MQSKSRSVWVEGLAINLTSNAIGFLVGIIAAYLSHEGSSWVFPLLFGAMAWLLTVGIWLVASVLRTLPARQVRITDSNLRTVLRNWLDDIGLKVKSAAEESAEFTFIVTTDGGKVISIMRHKDNFPEYLTFRAYFKDEAQNNAFSHFSEEEKIEARLTIQLELARAVMGYVAPDILEGFTLFKRIPISPALDIDDVSRTLWEVEAALASVFYAGARMLARKKRADALLTDGLSSEG
jgi:hypothetical protein